MIRAIEPLPNLDADVTVPGSKSYTQRALIIAALAAGSSRLRGPLFSEDTEYMIEALRSFGATIHKRADALIVTGTGGRISPPGHPVQLGNNGTALRLLSTVAALGKGPFTLTGDPRLCERPVRPLLDALTALGVDARGRDGTNGLPPVEIDAGGIRGGHVVLHDIESSQYVSSLLIGAPYAKHEVVIDLMGRVPSLPYVAMTVEAMRAFGAGPRVAEPRHYIVDRSARYTGQECRIEGDASSASYFFLAAALLKGRIRVENVNPRTLQGDIGFVSILEGMGCRAERGDHSLTITGGDLARGDLSFDLSDMPDMVPTLAVLAAVRPGRTAIANVAHLRHKESNRLAALAAELRRVGIQADETEGGLLIEGGRPHGADIETYNDHRIAMSFAILGLLVPGMRIANPDCVGKSFPSFWETLGGLRLR